jgi:hypothetical protein
MARAKPQIGKVLLVGLGSGLIAAWTMNQFQAALSKASRIAKEDEPKGTPPQSNSGDEVPEDATLKAADRIIGIVLKRKLSKKEKKEAGPIVHYAFGASMGALYSMAAEIYPEVTRGFGTGFGTALFAAADEVAVPMLGLAQGPNKYPLSSHASAFAAHLIYGVTTESVRRASMAIL